MIRWRFLLSALFVTGIACRTTCQVLPFQQYTTKDGLPANGINTLLQDPGGFLWIGTAEGLTRYDGLGFTTYRTPDGLPMNFITCIAECRAEPGALWVGTSNGGFARYAGGHFTGFLRDSSNEVRTINSLIEDRTGVLWIATNSGLYALSPNAPAPTLRSRRWPFDGGFAERPDGSILVGVDDSLLTLSHGIVSGGFRLEDAGRVGEIRSIILDGEGLLWVATSGGYVEHLRGAEVVARAKLPVPANGMAADASGNLWVSTTEGMLFVRQGASRFLPITCWGEENGLPTRRLSCIIVDREQNVWIGTSGKGLLKTDRDPVLSFPNGTLPENTPGVPQANVDRDAHVWSVIAGGVSEIWQRPDGTWERHAHSFLRKGRRRQPSSVVTLPDGSLWIGFTDGGISSFRITGGPGPALAERRHLQTGEDLPATQWMTFIVDDRQTLWYSVAHEGVYEFDLSSGAKLLRRLSTEDGLPDKEIRVIYLGRHNTIWFGGDHGGCALLQRGEDGTQSLRRFSVGDGLPDGHVRSFLDGDDGKVWMGTRDGGLTVLEEGKFHSYGIPDGLLSNTVWSLARGLGNRILLGTAVGLQPFDAENRMVLPGYPAFRGSTVIRCGLLSGNVVWAVTPESFRVFEETVSRWRGIQFPVHITAFQVNGRSTAPGSLREFPYDQNSCTIEYVGIWLTDQPSVRYQYRMPDAMPDWSLPTDHHAVTFAGLEPGRYRFEVRALNATGGTSIAPAVLEFTIHAPYWASWWFRALAALSAMAVALLGYRYRLNRVLELQRTRNRIARDLHDEVGSTLASISHFAESIKHGAGLSPDPGTSRFLSLITESSTSARAAMRDIIWSLDPANDTWEKFSARLRRHAADVLESRGICHSVDVTHDAPPRTLRFETQRNLWLVYKEIIANAVDHSGCTEVRIRVSTSGRVLNVDISDNGCGFDSTHHPEGNGLRNIMARVAATGGIATLETSVGSGARWHVACPL